MSAPLCIIDLPAEIWLHIISFLPKGKVRKLIGLNRVFYEAAMDDIFREVHLRANNDAWRNLERLTQIQQGGIGSRIRALHVYPPAVEPEPHSVGVLSHLKAIFSDRKSNALHENEHDLLVKALHRAITYCKNVQDLDLYHESEFGLNDNPSPRFLQDMWAVMGQNLRKLKIECPSDKFALLLDTGATTSVTNLEELVITTPFIHSSRSVYPSTSSRLINRPLISLVQAQRHSLRSLTLKSLERLNLTSYIDEFGYFPCLNQLTIRLEFDHINLPIPSTLTRFLDTHKATLQAIDIRCIYDKREATYSTWILQELPTLEFPALQKLVIGVWTCQFPQVPRLRILDISVHSHNDIPKMLEGLHRSSGHHQVKQVAFTSYNSLRIKLGTSRHQSV